MTTDDLSPSRIKHVFERCQSENRAALISYLTAGDPDPASSSTLMLALAGQSDIVEIGMPFSDPMADGPVIQAASERALAAGTRISDVFEITRTVREAYPELGIVLMGYANIPYAMGFERFSERAKAAGADAVLLVDIPPEEGAICDAALAEHGLERILLLSPTSTDERIRLVCESGSGFVYYVSLTGITGADMGDMDDIQAKTDHIRAMSDMPVCVGFGVKTPVQAAAVGRFADGVVVGSHFVNQITAHADAQARCAGLKAAAVAMKQAIAGARL